MRGLGTLPKIKYRCFEVQQGRAMAKKAQRA